MATPTKLRQSQDDDSIEQDTPQEPVRRFRRVARALMNILGDGHAIGDRFEMKLALESFHDKLCELCELGVLEKQGFALEIMAIADPAEDENDENVSYLAAVVVLTLMECQCDSNEAEAYLTVNDMLEVVGEVCMGMGYVRDRLELEFNEQRAKGDQHAKAMANLEAHIKDAIAVRTTKLVRKIYISRQVREATIENLEGKSLVLPMPKWNAKPTHGANATAPVDVVRPIAAGNSSEEAAGSTPAATAVSDVLVGSVSSPSITRPEVVLHPRVSSATSITSTNPTTQPSTARPAPVLPSRGNKTNHTAGRYTLEEKISILRIFPKTDSDSESDIERAHRQATGATGRTYNGLRQH